MNTQLIKARLISFGWSILSLVGTTIAGVLLSPDFAALVTQNFGQGVVSTLILLAVTELVKHVRNVQVLKSAEASFGSAHGSENVILI